MPLKCFDILWQTKLKINDCFWLCFFQRQLLYTEIYFPNSRLNVWMFVYFAPIAPFLLARDIIYCCHESYTDWRTAAIKTHTRTRAHTRKRKSLPTIQRYKNVNNRERKKSKKRKTLTQNNLLKCDYTGIFKLCFVPLDLYVRIYSCLHHCKRARICTHAHTILY